MAGSLDGHELALLDAREEGEFGASHLFWAVPCPLSQARAARPHAAAATRRARLCVDDGRGLAEHLAAWLESIGCTDVAVLDGGTKAWTAAGYVLFSGINVPSKAFGEWVEHHYGTESVDPPDLKSWIDERPQHGRAGQPHATRNSCACRSPPASACPAASWSIASATSPPTQRRWWW